VKKISSWGNNPKVNHEEVKFFSGSSPITFDRGSYLVHGLGRSYGDVCLNENGTIILTNGLNNILEFDTNNGTLKCEAGLSLKEILEIIVPHGWFLPVVPGTQNISLGGAIANDIHGKNHHQHGSFGNFVNSFELVRSDGETYFCNQTKNIKYFKATIGGMGLTGIITSAEIRLLKINNPYVNIRTKKYRSLEEYIEINNEGEEKFSYTVSWVDCIMKNYGGLRGVFLAGNHYESEKEEQKKSLGNLQISFPFTPPLSFVNNLSMKIINESYYRLNKDIESKIQHYRPFFFPLDVIGKWNKGYGLKGFYQYQFVIPNENSIKGVKTILSEIQNNGQIPALGVLKNFGEIESIGMMSFPREGLTMALDFPNKGTQTLDFFNRLDQIVMEYGGALYPAKDARMSKKIFYSSFPKIEEFKKYIDPKFSSSFWRRVNNL